MPAQGLALWEPRPDVFPDGMAPVDAAIGDQPLILHNRWFDPGCQYITELGEATEKKMMMMTQKKKKPEKKEN